MKTIRTPQIYAIIALVISIVYFIVAAHSSELIIYDIKETVLVLFFLCILFVPDRLSKLWLIPFWAYPVLSIVEIVLESQNYNSYFSDYIVEYSLEFAMFVFAGIILLAIKGGQKGMRITLTVLLVIFGLTVVYKSLWYVVLGDNGYVATYLLFSLPEALSMICILSYDKMQDKTISPK